jgi:tRNA-dependent cyclodipeptide synthase
MMTNETRYKVAVKNGAGWRQYSGLRLLISVGQPYHEGAKLAAVVDWINRNSSITYVQISVNDELQRWNGVANGLDPETARTAAVEAGQQWIRTQERLLGTLRAPTVELIRWGRWLRHPDYSAAAAALDALLGDKGDERLARLIEEESWAILERRKRRLLVPDEGKFIACSQAFIREELAVLALQQRDRGIADVYPGSLLTSAQWFKDPDNRLPPILEPLRTRYFCRIDFDRADHRPIPSHLALKVA